MVEDVLVIQPLAHEMIDAGAKLIELLDEQGFVIDAGMWLLMPEKGTWRLVLASPTVHRDGPRQAYRTIQLVLAKSAALPQLSLANITVLDSADHIIQVLRKVAKTGPGIHSFRFTRNTVNGVHIPDAHIYRLT